MRRLSLGRRLLRAAGLLVNSRGGSREAWLWPRIPASAGVVAISMVLAWHGMTLALAWAGQAPAAPQQVQPRQATAPRPVARAGLLQLPPPTGARLLAPKAKAWINPAKKVVIMDGEVCFREGPIEMFACTRGTKEYESIVSVDTRAFVIHAALLSLGAKVGSPARFTPTYRPASGTEVAIELHWIGADGKPHKCRAQDWIRNVHTKRAMTHDWVFAGSGFYTDPQTGQKHYQAEGGDFICVSNFPSAMLDLPIESSQANQSLLFEAFTARIPRLGTRVRLILRPKLTRPKRDAKKSTTDKGP